MAKVAHTYVPLYPQGKRNPECPFGVRDLSRDECYSGNGRNRCRWFVRYEWGNKHDGCIHCTHPLIDVKQLSLFD